MLQIIMILLAVGLTAWIGLVIFVTISEKKVPSPRPDETQAIIVLGAQVKENGELSIQLKWRLDKALEVYGQNPQTIVVCGARGKNEPVSEAQAMRDYLLSNGISEEDVLMEDSSFNTRQNLMNAKDMLPEGLQRVLIVTSSYHLPRALALASDIGMEAGGAGSPVKPVYWFKNHCREALAWVKYWMQKYGIMMI